MAFSSSASSGGSFNAPKNVVVIGGGVQGTSVAYQILEQSADPSLSVTILEAKATASAASGKGGGFMARSWGDGSPTEKLHHLAFDMFEELAKPNQLNLSSYRKLPTLSVSPGYKGVSAARKDRRLGPLMPDWLDGDVGRISAMGLGDDTAQISPAEYVHAMLDKAGDKIKVVLGSCTGVETDQGSERGSRKITAVKYTPRSESGADGTDAVATLEEECMLPADAVVVSAGPWSCAAEDWFQGAVDLPIEGIKSTSIVWKKPEGSDSVDGTALFCGEDHRFGTHRECLLLRFLVMYQSFLLRCFPNLRRRCSHTFGSLRFFSCRSFVRTSCRCLASDACCSFV